MVFQLAWGEKEGILYGCEENTCGQDEIYRFERDTEGFCAGSANEGPD